MWGFTVHEEHNGLGFGVGFPGGHIALETADGLDTASGLAVMDFAAEVVRAHANVSDIAVLLCIGSVKNRR